MTDIGEVYLVKIYFKGQKGDNKNRPVVIINVDKENDINTIAEITSVKPDGSYYSQFKEKINNWKICGLDKISYVKCKNVHNITNDRLFKQIGIMDDDDLLRIIDKVIEYNS